MVNSVGSPKKGFQVRSNYNVEDFRQLMQLLCGPDGCPWDREQTHESIKRNLLEEAYEAAEAIDNNDTKGLIEELGDVLMQVIFHANIADRAGTFDLDKIADAACKKLIRRHPHVFGKVRAKNGSESLVFWEDIKHKEKLHDGASDAMKAVARNIPELWRAEKIQKKAAKVGFDWPSYRGALEALRTELDELESAIRAANEGDTVNTGEELKAVTTDAIQEELGDLLFSIVNVARFFDVDPEEALSASSDKFISRFQKLEDTAKSQGKDLKGMTLDEMESIYQQVKLEE